jgi:hypothetical protein
MTPSARTLDPVGPRCRDLVLMHFVVAAIEEKLARSPGAAAKRRGTTV